MFDDAVKTIKAQLYDRLTSPLFGTFAISWLGWNWRFPVLFISDSSMHVVNKFDYVTSTLYPNQSTYWLNGLLYPLLTTAFFIFIYPWLARPVYEYWRIQIKKQKEIQQRIEDETPMTVEEARELKRETLKSELKYQIESEQREQRIKELEEIIKSLQQKSVEPETNNDTYKQNFIETKKNRTKETIQKMLAVLTELAPHKGIDRESVVVNLPTMEQVEKEHIIDELVDGGFLSENSIGELSLRPKGRTALVTKEIGE